MAQIKQIPPRAPEGMDPEQWQRVRELVQQSNLVDSNLPGLSTQQARTQIVTTELPSGNNPADTWTALDLSTETGDATPVGLSLVGNQIVYTTAGSNNILFQASVGLAWSVTANTRVGFRKNGNDATVIPFLTSTNELEFAAPIITCFDMAQNDYVELVLRPNVLLNGVQQNIVLYAQNTGFPSA